VRIDNGAWHHTEDNSCMPKADDNNVADRLIGFRLGSAYNQNALRFIALNVSWAMPNRITSQ
jgi:hypothetical protein